MQKHSTSMDEKGLSPSIDDISSSPSNNFTKMRKRESGYFTDSAVNSPFCKSNINSPASQSSSSDAKHFTFDFDINRSEENISNCCIQERNPDVNESGETEGISCHTSCFKLDNISTANTRGKTPQNECFNFKDSSLEESLHTGPASNNSIEPRLEEDLNSSYISQPSDNDSVTVYETVECQISTAVEDDPFPQPRLNIGSRQYLWKSRYFGGSNTRSSYQNLPFFAPENPAFLRSYSTCEGRGDESVMGESRLCNDSSNNSSSSVSFHDPIVAQQNEVPATLQASLPDVVLDTSSEVRNYGLTLRTISDEYFAPYERRYSENQRRLTLVRIIQFLQRRATEYVDDNIV